MKFPVENNRSTSKIYLEPVGPNQDFLIQQESKT